MVYVRKFLVAAFVASPALIAAQEPICNPCVDGPEMFEHRRNEPRVPVLRVSDAIVLVEPVRIAFYETAPSALATSMMRAVREHCGGMRAAERQRAQSSRPEEWYCGTEQRLRFVRGVNVLGDQYKTGLACDEQSLPKLKFYTEDMFNGDAQCVAIAYDARRKRHLVELEVSP